MTQLNLTVKELRAILQTTDMSVAEFLNKLSHLKAQNYEQSS